jgi:hypothetical protein
LEDAKERLAKVEKEWRAAKDTADRATQRRADAARRQAAYADDRKFSPEKSAARPGGSSGLTATYGGSGAAPGSVARRRTAPAARSPTTKQQEQVRFGFKNRSGVDDNLNFSLCSKTLFPCHP